MTTMMKAILIDPKARTVIDVECGNDLEDYYAHLQCRLFDVRTLSNFGDVMYFDDEGLLSGEPLHFFALGGNMGSPFCGRGLILGTGEEGKTVGARFTADEIRHLVTFLSGPQAVALYNHVEAERHADAEKRKAEGFNVIVIPGPRLTLSDAGEVFAE